MKNLRLIIIAFIVVVFVGGGYFLLSQRQSGQGQNTLPVINLQKPQVAEFAKGEKVQDVTLTDFEGKTYKLSDFAGKAVVLDFWAAWCPFCLEEMPELQKAQERYKDELVMIGVHRTDTEKTDTGLKFARERGVSYLLVKDDEGSLYRAAGGFGMPVAVFIDKEGIVVEIKSGPKTVEEIQEKVSNLIR